MFFDTETTGLPKYRDQAYKAPGNWPHIVSIAWIILNSDLTDINGKFHKNLLKYMV